MMLQESEDNQAAEGCDVMCDGGLVQSRRMGSGVARCLPASLQYLSGQLGQVLQGALRLLG